MSVCYAFPNSHSPNFPQSQITLPVGQCDNSDNNIVSMVAEHVVSGSRSESCQTLNYICRSYGLHKYFLSESCLSRIQDGSAESDK